MLPDRQWLFPTPAARLARDPMGLVDTAPIDHLRVFLGVGRTDYPWIIGPTEELADRLSARGMESGPGTP